MKQGKRLSEYRKTVFKAVVGMIVFSYGVLILTNKSTLNQLVSRNYPVQGVDVSHYQGKIDWERFREQQVYFAFIKATEGSSHTDEYFADNWEKAKVAGIATGAYHFFSFDSPASAQAEHYIETVGDLSGRMIPVVDVEYYGNKKQNPPDVPEVQKNLDEMLTILEHYYGYKPMIYTTYSFYQEYIMGMFEDHPLWLRNVYYPPIDIGRKWQFWQYSDQGKLEGMSGSEPCIDFNVFVGDFEDFRDYVVEGIQD